MSILGDILGLGREPHDLSLDNVLARSLIVFFYLLLLLRVAKRRFLAQRDPLDVLLAFLLASMISRAINGSAPFLETLAGGLLLVLLHRLLTQLCFRSRIVEHALKGEADVVVKDGQLVTAALARHALSQEDLSADLRLTAHSGEWTTLKCARLERNGRLSVETK